MTTITKYHWKRDTVDARDHTYSIRELTAAPKTVDLRANCSAIEDQHFLFCFFPFLQDHGFVH